MGRLRLAKHRLAREHDRSPQRHVFTAALSLVGTAGAVLPAQAASIAINNASFEADVLANDGGTDNIVTGWSSAIAAVCSAVCFGACNPGPGQP